MTIDDIWSCMVSRDGAVCTVALAGEIDMSVHEAVLAVLLLEIDASGTDAVRVDLAAVSFLGSAGLRVLVEAKQAAEARACTFVVTGAKGPVRQVLEISELLGLLTEDGPSTSL
ncbi:STAS domain-containing protein [Actinoplanes sp. NPDC048796]|uniref:STAS domain-containing protein n=1 Tax=Actinoplanes sp. NPDC048796 TaxID=3155640 RepID=UPI0033E384F5